VSRGWGEEGEAGGHGGGGGAAAREAAADAREWSLTVSPRSRARRSAAGPDPPPYCCPYPCPYCTLTPSPSLRPACAP